MNSKNTFAGLRRSTDKIFQISSQIQYNRMYYVAYCYIVDICDII